MDLQIIKQSAYLYEIELAKSKLASRGIASFIRNEYVNHVAVMPISQNYFLLVSAENFVESQCVLNDTQDGLEESFEEDVP